ncbi:MAG: hypothetical protein ACHP6H_06225 [Legionellales bacterium]
MVIIKRLDVIPSLVHDNSVEIYQLRIWLKGSSPMIGRRLLVKSNSTIADLHSTIQIGPSTTLLRNFLVWYYTHKEWS